jgi:hypothetical protein
MHIYTYSHTYLHIFNWHTLIRDTREGSRCGDDLH